MEKSKNKKKNTKKNKIKYNEEVLGISIIVLALLIILSIFNFNMGIIGSIINKFSFFISGFAAYLLPFFIITIGIIITLDKFNSKEKKLIISLSIIFISIMIMLDNINPVHLNFVDRINNSIALGKSAKGGGVLGGILGFFFYKLFDTIGTYLILLSTIIINILIITDIRVENIITLIGSKMKTKPKLSNVKKEKSSSLKEKKILNPKFIDNKQEVIKIMDYTKIDLKNSTKELETSEDLNDIDMEVKIEQNKNLNSTYKFPSLDLLKSTEIKTNKDDEEEVLNNANIIEETMKNFGIDAKIVQINRGPTITCYELEPAPGIKLSRIVSLSDNIALSLASSDIRIEAPIPGKAAVGIEVPNKIKDNVLFKELILSDIYKDIDSKLPLALGKNVSGESVISTIDKMPHLLIAGATGSGKSVCINTIISSILYKSSPEDVKLLLIDPKVVELNVYNGIPHLLIPVVTDAKKASFALNWAVTEMERRYQEFAKNNVRDISSYNKKVENKVDKLPMIVIIIDELADLMMVAAQEIEDYICRLAQMARAAGMYLIVATQRPSVDVITGTIKANIPSRISFAVSSHIDSRTILDIGGAEKLLGKGDMLFYPSFYSKPVRLQGAFISDDEVSSIVEFLKGQDIGGYDEDIVGVLENSQAISLDDSDELLSDAINLVVSEGQASISLLQRKLKIGYTRAARIVDEMESKGIVGGHEGSKPRKVLISTRDLDSVMKTNLEP